MVDLFSFAKPVKGYERYLVNRDGHVFSDGSDGKMRELAPCKTPSGYLKVWLYKQGKRKMFYIHRLVVNAFLKNPLNLPCVNHKDFDKTNNKVENLEPCTSRYNMIYNSIFGKHSIKVCRCDVEQEKEKAAGAISSRQEEGFSWLL